MIVTTQAIADKDYTLYDSALSFSFTDWTEDIGVCGGFNYWQIQTDGSPVPTFIQLNSVTRTFTI